MVRRDDDHGGGNDDVDRAILVGQGSWRYDLYGGNGLTYDDVIAVSPFNEPIYLVGTVPGRVILELNRTMNGGNGTTAAYYASLPEWILAGRVHPDRDCELYGHHFGLPAVQEALRRIYPDLGDPTETNLTSTTIWLSFVADRWRCPGGLLNNPWLTNVNSEIQNHPQTINRLMLGLTIVLGVLFVLVVCRCCCYRPLCGCCGGRSWSRDKDYGEMEAFHDVAPTADDADDYDNQGERGSHHNGHNGDEPPVQIV
jgi:hypothetical protein